MYLEIIAFWGFLSLILIIAAEMHVSLRMCGLIGSMLLIPMAFWVWNSGVEIQSGQVTVFSNQDVVLEVANTNGTNIQNGSSTTVPPDTTSVFTSILNTSSNNTITTTFGHNETITKLYTAVSLPWFDIGKTLSLLLFAMSIYGMTNYAFTIQKARG